jgi:Fe-S cluster assembly ATP-binding protein
MGPNGSGKSTLAYVLAGKTNYQVTAGEVLFDGEDPLAMQPDERAARGVFLAFQYPMEIPGVSGARRHPLRHAAARALGRHGYLPHVLRSLQYEG